MSSTTATSDSSKSQLPIIYILSFIGDMNYNMLLLISILLANNLGADTLTVGWISACYGLTYVIMPAILGRFGDKLSRKQNLLLSTFLQVGLSIYFIFFVRSLVTILIGHILFGIANSFYFPGIEASISEATGHSAESHKRGFFNYSLAWTFGSAMSFLGGYFSDTNIKMGFIIITIIYLIGFLLVLLRLPTKNASISTSNPPEEIDSALNSHENPPTTLNSPLKMNTSELKKRAIIILIVVLINTMIIKLITSYFPDYAHRPEGLNLSGTLIGYITLGFSLGRVFYFIVGRFWQIRFKVIPQSLLVVSILLVFVMWATQSWLLIGIYVLSGFFIGRIYVTSLESLLMQETKSKGAKAGLFESFLGLGISSATIIAGGLASFNLVLPFGVYAGMAFILAMIIFVILKKHPNMSQ